MQYLLLIYDNEAEMLANRTGSGEVMMKEYREFTDSILKSGHMKAGDALQPTSTATTRARPQRQDADHGRAVRRDEGAARRLLPGRGEGSRRGDQDRRARSRRAKSGTIEVRPVRVFAG